MKSFKTFFTEATTHDAIQSKFQEIGNELKGGYHEYIHGQLHKIADAAKQHEGKNYDQLFNSTRGIYHYNHPHKDIVRAVMHTGKSSGRMSDPYEMKPNKDEILAKMAKEHAEHFTDGFVHKNTAKLGGIVGDKKIKKMTHTINPRNLEGRLGVEHEDGSGFTASFSTVSKMSPKGKWFHQWPTRFHNVVNSDGTRMKSASEAKMKKEFN